MRRIASWFRSKTAVWVTLVLLGVYFCVSQIVLYRALVADGFSAWRCVCTGCAFVLFMWSLADKPARYFAGLIPLFFAIFCCFVISYYRYFHVVPTLSVLTLRGQAISVIDMIPMLLTGGLGVVCLGGVVLSGMYMVCLFPKTSRTKRSVALLVSIVLLACSPAYTMLWNVRHPMKHELAHDAAGVLFYYSPVEGLRRFGLLSYLYYQQRFVSARPQVIHPLPNPSPPKRKTEQARKLWNVIMIQVESLDNALIGHTSCGHEVTPFLNSLATKSLYFPHIYSLHGAGGSSDSELAAISGILPLNNHPSMSLFDLTALPSLCRTLRPLGYQCVGFHGNTGDFWNRRNAYRQLGFHQFLGESSFRGEARGFRSMDHLFFQQSVQYLEALRSRSRPFLAYMITQSMHGPFPNCIKHKGVDFSPEPDVVCRYFNVAKYTDCALDDFVQALHRRGFLANTVLMIFGDHTAGVRTASYSSRTDDGENIPLLILLPETIRGQIGTYGSQVDFAPTVVDLLGVNTEPSWIGRSLLRWDPDRRFPFQLAQPTPLVTPAGLLSLDNVPPIYAALLKYSNSYFVGMPQTQRHETDLRDVQFVARIDDTTEAFDRSYRRGLRYFEVDFSPAADGQLTATHCDHIFSRFEERSDCHMIVNSKVAGYQPLKDIAPLVRRRGSELIRRIIPQIHDPKELAEVHSLGFEKLILMLSQSRLADDEIVALAARNVGVVGVAVSTTRFTQSLAARLRKLGVPSLFTQSTTRQSWTIFFPWVRRGFIPMFPKTRWMC